MPTGLDLDIPMIRVSASEFNALRAKMAAKKAKRAEKAKTLWPKKVKRPKSPTHASLEKARWAAFSLFIRRRDNKLYGGKCFTCDINPIHDAGHIISRRKLATKYHPDCVHGQCRRCNYSDRFVPGYHDFCVSVFIRKLGLEKYQELVALSRTILHESRADIIEATEKYRKELGAP